jgi:hypothetical protein
MTRSELEHLLRAAGSIADDKEIVVIGSQSVLGQFPNAPVELLASMEADIFPLSRPERADLVDASIGEGSRFHESFGYYAQGVSAKTAILPAGWQKRLVAISNQNTSGVTGLCLEVNDLAISKYIAGREKDLLFTRALSQRLGETTIKKPLRTIVAARIARDFGKLKV